MRRAARHPLEGSALRAGARLPRWWRPTWERRAASPRIGEAYGPAPAQPAAARRVGLVAALVLLVPVALAPGAALAPVVGFVALLACLHFRCRSLRVVVPTVLLAALLHGALAVGLRALLGAGASP